MHSSGISREGGGRKRPKQTERLGRGFVCLIVGSLKWSHGCDTNMKVCSISGPGAPSSEEPGFRPNNRPLYCLQGTDSSRDRAKWKGSGGFRGSGWEWIIFSFSGILQRKQSLMLLWGVYSVWSFFMYLTEVFCKPKITLRNHSRWEFHMEVLLVLTDQGDFLAYCIFLS